MKRIFRKNQIIITVLAVMIAVAGVPELFRPPAGGGGRPDCVGGRYGTAHSRE